MLTHICIISTESRRALSIHTPGAYEGGGIFGGKILNLLYKVLGKRSVLFEK